MPDFVLTIIILTLSCLLLLNSGLQQELSTFLWAHRLLCVTLLVRADRWVQQWNTECDHRYKIVEVPIWLLPWPVLIASIVVCRSTLSFCFDCIYLHKNQWIYQWLLIEDVVLCHCWSHLLICIVVDNDVNIATKQCFSCTSNALSCYISTTSSYQKLHTFS